MNSAAWWPTLIVVVIATVTDLRWRRIPNWLVMPFLAAGLATSVASAGWAGLGRSLAGAAVPAASLGILLLLRAMGAGDVKLCAAIGAWIGPGQMVSALLVTGMCGGVFAIAYALWHRSLGKSIAGAGRVFLAFTGCPPADLTLDDPDALKMPYAPAIAFGTLFSFFMV